MNLIKKGAILLFASSDSLKFHSFYQKNNMIKSDLRLFSMISEREYIL